MGERTCERDRAKFLTVAPFECAWSKHFKFREAGRGCVAFEAFAHNDVTVVFREEVGSQHCHYKRDTSPHYTVIFGSNRNRRLKIEVDGRTVVDVAGIGLCCSSGFQSYWISIYDGLICIGQGKYPFQNFVFQWLDSHPNHSIRYVGFSSWDKHVGYRNVNVLPVTTNHMFLWRNVDCGDHMIDDGDDDILDDFNSFEKPDIARFLESWDFADVLFVVGEEAKNVPAHTVILQACGNFGMSLNNHHRIVHLQEYSYPILHALLQYMYTGSTQVLVSQICDLRALSLRYEVLSLAKQCNEAIGHFNPNQKLFESGNNVMIFYQCSESHGSPGFPFGTPISLERLNEFYATGEHTDMEIFVEGHDFIARSHKIILSLWSVPFMKMLTNGMRESVLSTVNLKDVSPETIMVMLDFMYKGHLVMEGRMMADESLLLQLLLLADQFGIALLHQECCKMTLETLSEDSVCPILQAVSPVLSCKLIEETCKRKFALNFDYCTSTNPEFVFLDETTFSSVLQHPDLTVTSEEKVLDAILRWSAQDKELHEWVFFDDLLKNSTPEVLFGERSGLIGGLLEFVRFALMAYDLLNKLKNSNLCYKIFSLADFVNEAISQVLFGSSIPENGNDVRFQHRRSSYKELQYIFDGDNKGVLYFAGTSYGKHEWINPVLSKKVNITASSPTSRFTDPKVLVSRLFQGTCFTGPRREDGRSCAWWIIDLGQDHQLMCNFYTLRQDGSRAFLRSWSLQGSMDGGSWTNLRVHENDQRICKPGQFASWPLVGRTGLLPFRYFRVLMTGPTMDSSNPWKLCICFVELYGYFR